MPTYAPAVAIVGVHSITAMMVVKILLMACSRILLLDCLYGSAQNR
jgi:hypothetical protein